MVDITAEIRFHVVGKNDFEIVKILRTSVGGFVIPRVGDRIIRNGTPFEVVDVCWFYTEGDLTAIVVQAAELH